MAKASTLRARVRSFRYALAGIRHAFDGPNFRIQLCAGILVLIAGALLRVTAAQWLVLLLTSLAVLITEMLNTAIEAAVDVASPTFHPQARIAKDVAAGAVLTAATASVVVGLYIFVPRILHLVGH